MRVGPKNMEVVTRSAYWARAARFRATAARFRLIPSNRFAGRPVRRTFGCSTWPTTTSGPRACGLICDAPWAGGLTWLALSRNYLDDDSLTVIADSGRFTKLRTLHLAHNNLDQDRSDGEVITDAGVLGLAFAPSLARPPRPDTRVHGDYRPRRGRDPERPALAAVRPRLDGCDLSPEAVRILAASPRLARLSWLSLAANPRLSGDALMPLAESPYLSRLCELDVGGVYVGEQTLTALRERLGPRLSH